jgi:hypothetical protein
LNLDSARPASQRPLDRLIQNHLEGQPGSLDLESEQRLGIGINRDRGSHISNADSTICAVKIASIDRNSLFRRSAIKTALMHGSSGTAEVAQLCASDSPIPSGTAEVRGAVPCREQVAVIAPLGTGNVKGVGGWMVARPDHTALSGSGPRDRRFQPRRPVRIQAVRSPLPFTWVRSRRMNS